MDFTEIGWRSGLMLAVAAVAAYLVVSLIRLMRLRRRGGSATPTAPETRIPPEVLAVTAQVDSGEVAAPKFAEHLAWTRLEAEVGELRAELAQLREELSQLKAARRISPLYADAAALAQRGYDAHGIAGECGISVAEAELVLAMSDGGKNFDDEVDDGGSGQGKPVEPPGR
jgi:hypothetical protein